MLLIIDQGLLFKSLDLLSNIPSSMSLSDTSFSPVVTSDLYLDKNSITIQLLTVMQIEMLAIDHQTTWISLTLLPQFQLFQEGSGFLSFKLRYYSTGKDVL